MNLVKINYTKNKIFGHLLHILLILVHYFLSFVYFANFRRFHHPNVVSSLGHVQMEISTEIEYVEAEFPRSLANQINCHCKLKKDFQNIDPQKFSNKSKLLRFFIMIDHTNEH